MFGFELPPRFEFADFPLLRELLFEEILVDFEPTAPRFAVLADFDFPALFPPAERAFAPPFALLLDFAPRDFADDFPAAPFDADFFEDFEDDRPRADFDPEAELCDFFAELPEDFLPAAAPLLLALWPPRPLLLPDDFFEPEAPAALPAKAPSTPPTTVPIGPATLPMIAPVAAPAACFEIGGISRFSED